MTDESGSSVSALTRVDLHALDGCSFGLETGADVTDMASGTGRPMTVVEDVTQEQARPKERTSPTEETNRFTAGFASHLNDADPLFDGGTTHTYE